MFFLNQLFTGQHLANSGEAQLKKHPVIDNQRDVEDNWTDDDNDDNWTDDDNDNNLTVDDNDDDETDYDNDWTDDDWTDDDEDQEMMITMTGRMMMTTGWIRMTTRQMMTS